MKLAAWRRQEGLTQAQLAERLGCSQSYVSQMERTREPIVPGAEIMARIFELSGGAVEPNDFFALPRLDARCMQAA